MKTHPWQHSESGSTAVISIKKFINSGLYAETFSFLVSGCRISYALMLISNFESLSNIITSHFPTLSRPKKFVTEVLPSCFHRRPRCTKITITLVYANMIKPVSMISTTSHTTRYSTHGPKLITTNVITRSILQQHSYNTLFY
jgi:hypothetical protein